MLRLDKLIFDAISADADLMQAVGSNVKSTCIEVSPDEKDKTSLPYLLIIDEGKAPTDSTKDDGWMPSQWRVTAGVEVAGKSPNAVDDLTMKVMKAISNHIKTLSANGEDIPCLNEGYPKTQGIAWDWTKPCYFDTVLYQCDIEYDDDEQEE